MAAKKSIIVYCRDCGQSFDPAEILEKHGYKAIRMFDLPCWQGFCLKKTANVNISRRLSDKIREMLVGKEE